MSATDEQHERLGKGYPYTLRPELHKALMARGIDYWVAQGITFWNRDDGCECLAYGYEVDGVRKLAIKVVGFTDPAQAIAATLGQTVTGETSDGYHTFNELYHHRAVLFSVIVRNHPGLAWKSKLHHDGTMYDGMFIVGINTPKGQATYHYDIDPYWEMFDCKELERAPEWDGHTPDQAIERIATLGPRTCRLVETEHEQEIADEFGKGTFSYWAYDCSECGHENAEYGRFCAGCGAKVVGE